MKGSNDAERLGILLLVTFRFADFNAYQLLGIFIPWRPARNSSIREGNQGVCLLTATFEAISVKDVVFYLKSGPKTQVSDDQAPWMNTTKCFSLRPCFAVSPQLLDLEVVDNSTRPNNGIVTMKGKGDVQTWATLQKFRGFPCKF